MHPIFKTMVVALALASVMQGASASSPKTDFLNLMYWEYAPLSADHCRSKGYPADLIYKKWRNEQLDVHNMVENNLLRYLRRKGLSENETRVFLQGMRLEYRRMAAESIAKGRIPCQNFREVLHGYMRA